MNKSKQKIFYNIISQELTSKMKTMNHSASTLARTVDEQRNTILNILEGKPTSLHHLVWLTGLDIDFSEILQKFQEASLEDMGNGKQEENLDEGEGGFEALI